MIIGWGGRRFGVGMVVVTLTVLSSCGGPNDSPGPDEVAEREMVASSVDSEPETSVPDDDVPAISGPAELEVGEVARALAEDEAEIEAAIIGWATFPTDTSQGEAGLPLKFLTGRMHQRYAAIGTNNEANGWVSRSRGDDRVEFLELIVDQSAGTAEAVICLAGDLERRDAATDEILVADDGVPGKGWIAANRTEDGWKLGEFIFSRAVGENEPCVFSEG